MDIETPLDANKRRWVFICNHTCIGRCHERGSAWRTEKVDDKSNTLEALLRVETDHAVPSMTNYNARSTAAGLSEILASFATCRGKRVGGLKGLMAVGGSDCVFIDKRLLKDGGRIVINNNRPKLRIGKDINGKTVYELAARVLAWARYGLPEDYIPRHSSGRKCKTTQRHSMLEVCHTGRRCSVDAKFSGCINPMHLVWDTHANNVTTANRVASKKRKALTQRRWASPELVRPVQRSET